MTSEAGYSKLFQTAGLTSYVRPWYHPIQTLEWDDEGELQPLGKSMTYICMAVRNEPALGWNDDGELQPLGKTVTYMAVLIRNEPT